MNGLIGEAQEYILTGNQDAFDAFVSSASKQQGISLPKLHADESIVKVSSDQQAESRQTEQLQQIRMTRLAELYADDLEEIRKDATFVGSERQLEILRSILTIGQKTAEEKR